MGNEERLETKKKLSQDGGSLLVLNCNSNNLLFYVMNGKMCQSYLLPLLLHDRFERTCTVSLCTSLPWLMMKMLQVACCMNGYYKLRVSMVILIDVDDVVVVVVVVSDGD
jgi:hypothetical protein